METKNFIIRKPQSPDVTSICKIASLSKELEAHEGGGWYSEAQVKNWIEDERTVAYVALDKDAVVGFAFASCDKTRSVGYLEETAIHPDYRGHGLGSVLANKILADFKNLNVEYVYALVQEKNDRMVNFMIKKGFTKGYKFYWMDKKL